MAKCPVSIKVLNLINQRNENHTAPPPLTQQDGQNERDSATSGRNETVQPLGKMFWQYLLNPTYAVPPTRQFHGQTMCIQHNACIYPPNGMCGNARRGTFAVTRSWKLLECPRIAVWINHCRALARDCGTAIWMENPKWRAGIWMALTDYNFEPKTRHKICESIYIDLVTEKWL